MSKQIIFMLSFGHGQDEDPGAVSGSFVESRKSMKRQWTLVTSIC